MSGSFVQVGDKVAIYDELGNELDDKSQKWRELYDEYVRKGWIVPERDAANCPGCAEPLETLSVGIVLTTAEQPVEINRLELKWVRGHHQFMASPGFFGFVREGWAEFSASCPNCGCDAIDLEIVEEPHGLKFSDVTRMAGNL